jgi:uncharacterized hydrophobic protein (TIGR00271 family)
LIVALGILADNIVLVIGGMLVTPLLSPLLAVALGIVINDNKVIMRSVRIFLTAFGFSFVVAFVLGIFSSVSVEDISLIRIMEPSLFTFFISVVAGLAAAYTWVKPELNETLPGISITVTLIPPLTAIGLAVADGNFSIFGNVLKVLLLNIFGIIVASLMVFSLMDFYRAKQRVIEEVEEEEEIIKKEKEEIILNKE